MIFCLGALVTTLAALCLAGLLLGFTIALLLVVGLGLVETITARALVAAGLAPCFGRCEPADFTTLGPALLFWPGREP